MRACKPFPQRKISPSHSPSTDANVFYMSCRESTSVRISSTDNRALRFHFKSVCAGLFALFALIAIAQARGAFAQDADSSDPGAGWVRVDPDAPADSPGEDSSGAVLEIPQATCTPGDATTPCDAAGTASSGDPEDADQPIAVGGPPPASPQTFDDDTANAAPAGPDSDWGSPYDYANQSPYGFGYATTTYGTVVAGAPGYPNTSTSPFSHMAMSSPLTSPARPPLYPGGPWMTPPSMMSMNRPAGSPMAGAPFRFH